MPYVQSMCEALYYLLCQLITNRTFRQYKEGVHVLYPAICDVETFESDLLAFLANRRTNDTAMQMEISNDSMDGMSIRWIGLLFAVFASGTQFSSMPKRERELPSQVYGKNQLAKIILW